VVTSIGSTAPGSKRASKGSGVKITIELERLASDQITSTNSPCNAIEIAVARGHRLASVRIDPLIGAAARTAVKHRLAHAAPGYALEPLGALVPALATVIGVAERVDAVAIALQRIGPAGTVAELADLVFTARGPTLAAVLGIAVGIDTAHLALEQRLRARVGIAITVAIPRIAVSRITIAVARITISIAIARIPISIPISASRVLTLSRRLRSVAGLSKRAATPAIIKRRVAHGAAANQRIERDEFPLHGDSARS
jgi:hypothetical protein